MLTNITRSYSTIAVEVAPPAGSIRLTLPPRNIIDLRMMDELLAAIDSFEQRADLSYFVLSADGPSFSAGVDIAAHRPDQARDMLVKFHSVIRALVNTSKITLAAMQGACLGGGAELALVCDMIFCAEDSRWQFPEIDLGCFPPVAAVMLPQLVGAKRAAEMVFTGQVLHGDEALHLGLVNDSVPAAQLEDVIAEIGSRLATLSPRALALAKKALHKFDARRFDEHLQQVESIYLDELIPSADAFEGINAFLEKRMPRWTGR